ncbi:MAG TPA: alpha/beta hydrolase [Paracoccaceae bacterium]|nr:alpha/beta hydrolase [Paracoccaceae bacterium]
MTENAVWLGLTQAELDRQYDQRALVPDMADRMARWAAAGEALRRRRPPAVLRYGPHPDERLHLHPGRPGGPVHLHLHGGAWRALGADDADFVAPALGAEGATVAIPNFSLAPAEPLPAIVDQIRRAFLWLRATVPGAERLFVSGHSSGAHLAACLLDADWRREVGLPPDAPAGLTLVSGAYDLEPVRLSARNGYLRLSAAEADALSPIRRLPSDPPPVAVFWGEGEHEEFKRQSRDVAAALGPAAIVAEALPADHFEMYDAFADPGSRVVQAALAQMRAPG